MGRRNAISHPPSLPSIAARFDGQLWHFWQIWNAFHFVRSERERVVLTDWRNDFGAGPRHGNYEWEKRGT